MYCSHCGRQVDAAARFCPACGAAVQPVVLCARAGVRAAYAATLSARLRRSVLRPGAALWVGHHHGAAAVGAVRAVRRDRGAGVHHCVDRDSRGAVCAA